MRLKEELGVYTLFQIRLHRYEPRWSFIGIRGLPTNQVDKRVVQDGLVPNEIKGEIFKWLNMIRPRL